MTDVSALAQRVRDGEVALYELQDLADPEAATAVRRRIVAERTDADLEALADETLTAEDAAANVENMIGTARLPVGVAGPVTVEGSAATGEYHLPLATTEGALVASVNRGTALLDAAGGVTTRVTKTGMTRAPVFRVDGVVEAAAVTEWVEGNTDALRETAEETTSHGELIAVDPYVVGDSVFLRFAYDTKDAMGMNMVTIATEAACDLVESETAAELVALSGNLCADKKPAAINAIEGRARRGTTARPGLGRRRDQPSEELRREREGRESRIQRARGERRRGGLPGDRPGRRPGRRGRECHHDGRATRGRPLRERHPGES